MAKILFITPMWHEEATPHDAKVCNYFVDDWIKQGHEVVIVHYRSSFPSLFLKIAKMFPALRKRFVGTIRMSMRLSRISHTTIRAA